MFKNFSQKNFFGGGFAPPKNQLGGGQLHPLYASDNKLFQKEIITFFSNALWIHLRTVCGPPLSLMYVPLSQGGQKSSGEGGSWRTNTILEIKCTFQIQLMRKVILFQKT